jgi:hypothetical protein
MNQNRLSPAPGSRRLLVLAVGTFCLLACNVDATLAQAKRTGRSEAAIRYGAPVDTQWEFGLIITAGGDSKGISATVPIPMDWPEQEIGDPVELKSDGVGRIKYSNPTRESRQAAFNINRLRGGQAAKMVLRFNIKKQMIMAPHDPSKLKIASPVPSKLRTFIKPSPYIESNHARIKEIASQLEDSSLTGWQQVETIYRWVRDNVEYEFDTQIHSCLEALDDGKGDCEELSSLFIAICRAMDIPARAVWIPGHTYPEFYLEEDRGKGHWFPCQAAGQYEFGSMTELRPVLQKGDRFRLPGQTGYVRYLQPSLLAKDAAGELNLEWVSREVVDEKSTTEKPSGIRVYRGQRTGSADRSAK